MLSGDVIRIAASCVCHAIHQIKLIPAASRTWTSHMTHLTRIFTLTCHAIAYPTWYDHDTPEEDREINYMAFRDLLLKTGEDACMAYVPMTCRVCCLQPLLLMLREVMMLRDACVVDCCIPIATQCLVTSSNVHTICVSISYGHGCSRRWHICIHRRMHRYATQQHASQHNISTHPSLASSLASSRTCTSFSMLSILTCTCFCFTQVECSLRLFYRFGQEANQKGKGVYHVASHHASHCVPLMSLRLRVNLLISSRPLTM